MSESDFWGPDVTSFLEGITPQTEGHLWTWHRLVIPMDPVAKGRPRAGLTRGANPRAVMYTPKKTNDYEATLRSILFQALGDTYIVGVPVALHLDFYLKRPKRLMRKKDPEGEMPHLGKPDTDNLTKAVLDAMTHHLGDDSIVMSLVLRKMYTRKNHPPRVEVTLGWAAEEEGGE